MTSANVDRFNSEAAEWDSNPTVMQASHLAHQAILARLRKPEATSTYDVLDLGCGTGLLSLPLSSSVRSITAVDAAEGMIAALNTKISDPACKVTNVRPVSVLLENPDDPAIRTDPVDGTSHQPRRFDFVISHLVLHHIPDLHAVLRTMLGCLKLGGRVMLTDFEDFGPEARKFHPEHKMEGVERHGIRRADMEELLKKVGFVDVTIETAFELNKAVETVPGSRELKNIMTFPFLICCGTKPESTRGLSV
jgi:2-polyprenyl-3-methyl-5-hydroxy-6-metoxy-1,4-benzoquinol methylase